MMVELALGIAVGGVMALTGAGGGILAVPLLGFGLGMPVARAAPAALIAVGLAAMLGAGIGLRAGIVRYRAAVLMAAVGMPFAALGVWLGRQVDGHWLNILFAGVLLMVAYRHFRGGPGRDADGLPEAAVPCLRDAGTGRFVWTRPCAGALSLAGAAAGFLSGLLGVGGGFLIVPALARHSDLAMQSISATSLAVIALVSASAVASSAWSGGVDWATALPFAAGALIGMAAGRTVSGRLPEGALRKGFALLSALVAIGLVAKAVQHI
ncbi:MAG TPA: sulfite exporter TauE/SafE family protein [Rhodocyclaceae bacterium]|nr:sulfite exporter TauE/SafE family protein [Rhodocyclaceae bacterium]